MDGLNDVILTLSSLLGENRILTGGAIGADFAHDELPGGEPHMPDAVCIAKTADDVSAVLRTCHDAGVRVTVRGAGTGKAGGSVPVCGGIVLSVKDMDEVLGFDEEKKTLTVQTGVLLQDVKAEAAKHGLNYPPDPGEKTATVGGNASTNASGPCAVKYGKTADYIEDALIVLADGTKARLSENPEYKAVIGSEGTLGVIAELTLRLTDKAAADVILLLPFEDTESCIAAAEKIAESDFAPAVLEYLDTDMVEFSGKVTGNPVFPVEMDGERVGATLMLTLEGADDDELDEKMEGIAELSEELMCLDILVVDTTSLKRDVWDAHDAFHTSTETAKCEGELNVDIPSEQMANLIAFAKETGESEGLTVLTYGHIGSGGLHIHALSDAAKDEFAPAVERFTELVYKKCVELGGDIIGEYGIGYAKRLAVKELSPNKIEALGAAKAALDPKGVLNPGKVV